MAENKDQSHILALSKKTRQELKIYVGDRIYENDNDIEIEDMLLLYEGNYSKYD